MTAELRAIEKAKWLASEAAGHDLGNDFCVAWIADHAAEFRNAYDTSLCKTCHNINHCYDQLKVDCSRYEDI
jgi:hypothetical protein